MIEKIQGIVLDVVRHSDRHNVVTLYTRSRGRMAFLSPAGGGGKAGRLRNARLSPLAVVEADISLRGNRDLQLLPAVTAPVVWRTLYFDPVKSSVLLFMAEFLNRLLRDSAPDPRMYDYILHSLHTLDTLEQGLPNFHIAFLVHLASMAGIRPDTDTFAPGRCFDMRGGVFSDIRPLHPDFLPASEAAALTIWMRINFRNLRLFKATGEMRNHILSLILKYFAIHLPGTSNLKSPDILREIFS